MVVFPEKEVILVCPACSSKRQLKISVFSLKKREHEEFYCSCGLKLLTVKIINLEETLVRLYFFNDSEIKSFRLKEFINLDLGREIPRPRLKVQKDYDPLKDENFLKEYFVSPGIMYELLSHLEGLGCQGKIECECNNFKGELELFPEYLILRCQNCQSAKIFWAISEEDVLKLGQKAILLTKSTKEKN